MIDESFYEFPDDELEEMLHDISPTRVLIKESPNKIPSRDRPNDYKNQRWKEFDARLYFNKI